MATTITTTTTTAPTASLSLTSWEEAFTSHPLPTVRALERDLRKHISENQTKLRSLVGGSYRELLGTAERIIEMDGKMQEVEALMGDVGRRCNGGVVERVGRNYAGVVKRDGDRDGRSRSGRGSGKGVVAQIKVLEGAIGVTRRVVRRGGDALVGAKVCVLGRLLWKSVADVLADEEEEEEEGGGKYAILLEELRRKLALARKRLLAYIARSLVRTQRGNVDDEEKDKRRISTVHTLCAYSLLTSSAPKDVLRYFLQVRFEQLESKAEGSPSEENLLDMLDLYSQTLLDTRDVFPRRVGDTLSQLAKTTLVQDTDVRSVPELSLDVYAQWIAEDVRNFQPWVRHDQFSASDVSEALTSWTKQAQRCVLLAVSGSLQEQTNINAVLGLRHKVVTKYLSLSARLRSDSHVKAITDLRSAFLARLEELARQATKISSFDLDALPMGDTTMSATMWDLSTSDVNLEGGAVQFRQTVIARQHGRDDTTISVITSLNEWTERLQALTDAITAMKATKWDDDPDLDLDDLSEETPLQEVLGKQDAQVLQSTLRKETALALGDTYRKVTNSSESARNPTTLIRVLREIDTRRRALAEMLDDTPEVVQAEPSFIVGLHRQIATITASTAIQSYSKRLRARTPDTSSLWDNGTPPLPIQPSPGAFRFLKELHRSMSSTVGSDIWSPEAVRALKICVGESLSQAFANESYGEVKTGDLTNGHPANDDDHAVEERQSAADSEVPPPAVPAADNDTRRFMQLLFDVLYLRRVLRTSNQEDHQLDAVVEELKRRAEVNATGAERLAKSANEYWKRTYFLFGLLASGYAS